jgi:hypothetical protein
LAEDLAGLGQAGALGVLAVLDRGVVAVVRHRGAGVDLARPRGRPSAAPAARAGTASRASPCGRRRTL